MNTIWKMVVLGADANVETATGNIAVRVDLSEPIGRLRVIDRLRTGCGIYRAMLNEAGDLCAKTGHALDSDNEDFVRHHFPRAEWHVLVASPYPTFVATVGETVVAFAAPLARNRRELRRHGTKQSLCARMEAEP